ncbi:hypothetical protein AB6A40_009518 [Gnathostoma spinigerum]|uniref:Uncharacterized protein n=1 Tax=Gnathostoma spinigerum TaxID=75299 RepID=A0ABD6EXC7_9BILA
MIPLSFYVDLCTDVFSPDVNIKTIVKGVHELYNRTGGSEFFDATNIVFTRGSLDPWRAAIPSRTVPEKHITSIMIEGASHCADMYIPWTYEPHTLKPARRKIEEELRYFTGEEEPEVTTYQTELPEEYTTAGKGAQIAGVNTKLILFSLIAFFMV